MNIGICEDYAQSALTVRHALETWAADRDVDVRFYVYDSGEMLAESDDTLDLLFLDVRLPGISGSEAAERLRKRNENLEIVFCTAYSEYMRDALDLHAFGYLEKPFEKQAIVQIMDDFLKLRFERSSRPVYLKMEGGFEKYLIEDILYFERVGRKLFLNTFGRKQSVRMTLAAVYETLDSEDFVYIHKGCIVNMKYVKRLIADEVTMDDGAVLKVARPRSKDFRARWFDYMQKYSRS